jgi:tRNA(fMet)-specific endonuclease VapC
MTTYLLDTSIVIDVLNQKRNRQPFLENLVLQGDVLACCAVTITEIYAGMRDHERPRTDQFLDSLDYFDVTRAVAKDAGLLKRDWSKKGVTLALSDVTIAAVAIANNLTLLTDNTKHFPMPGIRLLPLPATP